MNPAMPLCFICPHCHSPVDLWTMDAAASGEARYRVGPVCDDPVPLAAAAENPDTSAQRPPQPTAVEARAGKGLR